MMRPGFRLSDPSLERSRCGGRRQVALSTKSDKICSQTSRSFVALQPRTVKDPLPRFRTVKTHSRLRLNASQCSIRDAMTVVMSCPLVFNLIFSAHQAVTA
jgi:hypothetical protein